MHLGILVRNTASMLFSNGGKAALQGAFFVLVARELGASAFGAFSSVVALAALLAPFGSLGSVNLMIKHIAADHRSAPSQFATSVTVTVSSGLVMVALLTAAAPLLAASSVSPGLVAIIAAADLLGVRLLEVACGAFGGLEQMFRIATFTAWFHGARLAGLALLILSPWKATLGTVATCYLITSLLAMIPLLYRARRIVGLARPDLVQFRREWREGILFSIGMAAQTVYNDIDKAMLARLSTLDATGIYTAAYRVVDMAFAPMRALLAAAYPRFFRYGLEGADRTIRFARQLAKPGIAYCLFASLALVAGAGLVPLVLGPSFDGTVGAIRGLAVLPLFKAAHYLAADSLTGAGYQGLRSTAQVGVAVANVLLNIWLIPAYGWRGAVASSLLCDGLLAVSLWAFLLVTARLERHPRVRAS